MTWIITFFLSDMQKVRGNIKDSFTFLLVINCYQICICNVLKNNLNFQIHFNSSLYFEYNSVSEIHSQLPSTCFFMLNESFAIIDGRSGEKEVSTHPLLFRKIKFIKSTL